MALAKVAWPAAWMAVGLIGGAVLVGFWPGAPAFAVATDRHENFAMCTGPVDEDVEGVFFLDFATGDLKATVINPQTGKFIAFYERNILPELGVDPSQNPRYLMVTGVANFRRGPGTVQAGNCVVYVAEITTGRVAAYAIPWAKQRVNSGIPTRAQLIPLDATQFRTAVIRDS